MRTIILYNSDESIDALITNLDLSTTFYDSLEENKDVDKGIFTEEELKTLKYFKITIEEIPDA